MAKLARRFRVPWILIAILLMLPLLAVIPLGRAVASQAPAASQQAAAKPSFVFEGGGWGHAVGMSQWGAYGQAKLDDADYRDILRHYYVGTDTAELGEGAVAVAPLWVNLEREVASVTLRNRVIRNDGAVASISRRGPDTEVAPNAAVSIEVIGTRADGSPRCRVTTTDGFKDRGPCALDLAWDGDNGDPSSRFVIETVQDADDVAPRACLLPDWNAVPTRFRECAYSRGQIHIRPDNDTQTFHVVVEIEIDDYVLGISEMPYYWSLPVDGANGLEALKAQAVAARSYAARRAIDRGAPEDRTFCWCHVHDTTVDQRYVGWGHSGLGQAGWIDAVASTAGIVSTHPAITRSGKRLPILTFYSSSSYGQTEPSEVGFGSPAVYLKSVDDSWARDSRIRNPQTTWSKTLGNREIGRALGWAKGRAVTAVEIVGCSPSGAASEVRFTDDDGETDVRATRHLRTALGLRSPQITAIDGVAPCRGNGDANAGVTAGALRIDDDAEGDSIGNGDGVAQCGETVELHTELRNAGNSDLTGVTATLVAANSAITVLHNPSSTFPRLGVIGSSENENDWDLAIASDVTATVVDLRVDVTADQGGPWTVAFELPIGCGSEPPPAGSVSIASRRIDDGPGGDSVGNDDGRAGCGETIELFIAIRNGLPVPLQSLSATLTVDRGGTLLHNEASEYPSLQSGAKGENANDWDIAIDAGTSRLAGNLHVVGDGAKEWTLPFRVPVRCGDAGATLRVGHVETDDGVLGDSVGNGDGAAQCGETVELTVTLRNRGDAAARGLTGTFIPKDDQLRVLHNTDSKFPNIKPGERGANDDDFDVKIARNTPDGHRARFRIRVADADGRVHRADGVIPIGCKASAPVAVEAVTVDDGVLGESVGNRDGVAQCGEIIELYVSLENRTTERLEGLTARLRSIGPHLDLLYNRTTAYPPIRPGATAENDDDWDLAIANPTPTRRLTFELVVKDDGERWVVPFVLPLSCS